MIGSHLQCPAPYLCDLQYSKDRKILAESRWDYSSTAKTQSDTAEIKKLYKVPYRVSIILWKQYKTSLHNEFTL